MSILADTSGLVALADTGDAGHRAAAAFVTTNPDVLVVPATALPEVDHLLARKAGPLAALPTFRAVVTGQLRLEGVTQTDLHRCIELMIQYADSRIGLVDASIVALAERLRITRILTLDHRHFRMLRPRHCPAFELVP